MKLRARLAVSRNLIRVVLSLVLPPAVYTWLWLFEVSEGRQKWLSDLISLRRDMDGMVVLAVSSQSLGRSFGVADVSAA